MHQAPVRKGIKAEPFRYSAQDAGVKDARPAFGPDVVLSHCNPVPERRQDGEASPYILTGSRKRQQGADHFRIGYAGCERGVEGKGLRRCLGKQPVDGIGKVGLGM